ncbi:MAG: right-handed parallel beta-helix repeat-containing protein, partial [Bacteroidota bacterium]
NDHGLAIDDVTISWTVESGGSPTITLNTSGFNGDFGSVVIGENSDERTYTVSGSNLTDDIDISAPTGFEISLTTGEGFTNTLSLVPDDGSVDATTIYVRFSPALEQEYSGNITHNSADAEEQTVAVSGTGIAEIPPEPVVIAKWTFEDVTTTNTGTTPIISVGSAVADSGQQTAGSAFTAFHASSATVWSNPAGNGSVKSVNSNNWGVGDYYQFQVSTVGYINISITWDQTGSSTGPRDFKVQYSTDGSNFTDASGTNSTYALIVSNWLSSTPAPEHTRTLDLSAVTALNFQATVYIRLVATSTTSMSGGTVGTAGTGRVDNFTVGGFFMPVHVSNPEGFFESIQDAVDAASSGATIRVVSGTYYEQVTIAAFDLTLQGVDNGGGLPLVNTSTLELNGVVVEAGNPGVTISSLRISSYNYGVVADDGCRGLTVTNCNISSSSADGIKVQNSDNVTITSNTVSNNAGKGIWVDGGSGHTISGNTASSNGSDGMKLVNEVSNSTVSGNTTNSNNGEGIGLGSEQGSTANNNRILNNTVNSNTFHGIKLFAGNGNTFTGNTVNSNGQNGIDIGEISGTWTGNV